MAFIQKKRKNSQLVKNPVKKRKITKGNIFPGSAKAMPGWKGHEEAGEPR